MEEICLSGSLKSPAVCLRRVAEYVIFRTKYAGGVLEKNQQNLNDTRELKRVALNKRKLGTEYERLTGDFLKSQGYDILEYNYRCRFGEIDIIARNNGYLVFLEVKYRASDALGHALDAVNQKKQRVILKVAEFYLMVHHMPEDTPCRFDVVGITGNEMILIKNAF